MIPPLFEVYPEEAKRLSVQCCGKVRATMFHPFCGEIHLIVTTPGGYVQEGDAFPKAVTKEVYLSQNWDTGGSCLRPIPVNEVEDDRKNHEANHGK